MPFDHRHLWHTRFVVAVLRGGGLSEAAVFRYFLAVMAFDWLQFTLVAVTPAPAVSAWATFGMTVLGLPWLYRCNGGAAGRQFLPRYFALSVTVGWKFVAAMLTAGWLVSMLLAQARPDLRGWSGAAALALVNLLMFRRIGLHLRALAASPR